MSKQQNFPIEGIRQRAKHYITLFNPSTAQLRRCYRSFLDELQNGLEMHARDANKWRPEESSLMMLDACVDFVPTGQEKGVYYAVDFGGTNLRAIRCTLDGSGTAKLTALKHNMRTSNNSASSLPKGLLDKKATASMLFDEIAVAVEQLIAQAGDANLKELGVALTFSFGAVQRTLRSAVLTGWTKDFETGNDTNDPVVGQDVGALLNKAFERKGMNARLAAVLNDTVGAMLSGSYSKSPEEPPCLVGVILGTGVNGAYVQPDAKNYGYQGVVMNTELGGFNKDLPECDIDYEIDYHSVSPGRQRFEKMCSGMYIPEIFRLAVIKVFQGAAPNDAWTKFTFTGEACGAIYNDKFPYTETARALSDLWQWHPTADELEIVQALVEAVFTRSAAIAAVSIAAMSKSTGRLQPAMGGLTVGVDGTLYVQNAAYQQKIKEYLERILEQHTADLINLVIAEDGSGKGAAILAATLACHS